MCANLLTHQIKHLWQIYQLESLLVFFLQWKSNILWKVLTAEVPLNAGSGFHVSKLTIFFFIPQVVLPELGLMFGLIILLSNDPGTDPGSSKTAPDHHTSFSMFTFSEEPSFP